MIYSSFVVSPEAFRACSLSSALVPITCVSESVFSFLLIWPKKGTSGGLPVDAEPPRLAPDTNSGPRTLRLFVYSASLSLSPNTLCCCPRLPGAGSEGGRVEGP